MTSSDFERWWADLILRFPSVETWLTKVAPFEDDQTALLRSWAIVLGDVDKGSALAVNLQMQSGDLPWVGEYDGDKERLPQHVRRLAKQLAYNEKEPEPVVEYQRPSTFPAGKILRRLMELTDNGMPSAEAKAIAFQEFPSIPPQWEPRFDCHLCQDSGRITVASNHAILAILDNNFARCHHREGVMRCCCHCGEKLSRKMRGREVPLETFDESKDFRIVDFCWSAAEVERFRAWAEDRKAAVAEEKAKSMVWTPDTSRHREYVK